MRTATGSHRRLRLIRGGEEGPWRLTARGRAVIEDPLVRASYAGFSGLHTALYRELGPLLAGGPRRRDIAGSGELIARLSGGFEPLVLARLTRAVTARAPRRVLDVGCGAGLELAAVLAAVPQAEGIGLDVDAGAVELAGRNLADQVRQAGFVPGPVELVAAGTPIVTMTAERGG